MQSAVFELDLRALLEFGSLKCKLSLSDNRAANVNNNWKLSYNFCKKKAILLCKSMHWARKLLNLLDLRENITLSRKVRPKQNIN